MFELPLPNFDRAAERLECEIESEMSRTPIATVDVQGLGPQRAELRRYLRWLADERAELGRLESIRARLAAGVDAPAHEASRSGAIARMRPDTGMDRKGRHRLAACAPHVRNGRDNGRREPPGGRRSPGRGDAACSRRNRPKDLPPAHACGFAREAPTGIR